MRGLGSITPTQGLELLGKLLVQKEPQIAAMDLNLRQWREFYMKAANWPFFNQLSQDQTASIKVQKPEGDIRERLQAAAPGPQRRTVLEALVREQVAQVLQISAPRVDMRMPLPDMGLDSLMAIEFRNRLEAQTGLVLTTTLIWSYPTVASLVDYLAQEMAIPLDASAQAVEVQTTSKDKQADLVEEIKDLDEEEMERLLLEKLASLSGNSQERK